MENSTKPSSVQAFKDYLEEQQHSPSTIQVHQNNISSFKLWAHEEQLDYEQLNYRELLSYIQHEKSRPITPQTINMRLNTITKYYDHLIEQGIREENPARRLRVKTQRRKVKSDLLKPEQLQEIYEQYKHKSDPIAIGWKIIRPLTILTHKRNTIILNLMIHQGVHAGELRRLETPHIDFDKGEIHIPGTRRSNPRELKLHPSQIIPLHTYILQTREQLNPKGDRLFSSNINNTLNQIIKNLQKISPEIKSANQIRSSVIMQWLKQHNIRQVQYMAGHRHISSTERYRQEDIEGLQEALLKFHPIG